MDSKNSKGKIFIKEWNKPKIFTLSTEEISVHIKAAAFSRPCGGGVSRWHIVGQIKYIKLFKKKLFFAW